MSHLSHTATGTVLLATLLLSACGGGDSAASTPSLMTLNEESQYAGAAVAILMPMQVLSVSGDFVQLPQGPSMASVKARQAMTMIRSSKQATASNTINAEIVREVETCGAGGEVVIETEGSVVTVWYKACREIQTVGDGVTFNTEQSGWARYTVLPSSEFDEAYAIEEDTVFKVKGGVNAETDYVEHLQARMRYFQQDQRLRLENVDYTLTDKGTYQGQPYDYTQAAQQLAFTSDPQVGVTFTGRVGGWGTYYNGDAMMNGLLEVASVLPLFFDPDGIPNVGSATVKGGNSTNALVEMRSKGYKLQLNGKPSLDILWQIPS